MGRKSFCVVNGQKYKYLAPDGGWGYMICVAVILNLITSTSFVSCFGVLFNDFLKERGISSTSVTLLSGINCISLSISGFMTGGLLKKMSYRQLGFIAAVLFNLGSLMTIFVRSFIELIIAMGVLQHTGIGILLNLGYSMLNEYFEKKRLFAFSFCKTLMGVSWMIAPLFVKWSLEEFGFRGTLAIIFGISMNLFVGVSLMQPVEWHRLMVQDNEKEDSDTDLKKNVKQFYDANNTDSHKVYLETVVELKNELTSDDKTSTTKKDKKNEELESLMKEHKTNIKIYKINDETHRESLNNRKSCEDIDTEEAQEMVDYVKRLSITHFPMEQIPIQKNKLTWKRIIQIMDLTLFKDVRYLVTCLCVTSAFFVDTTYSLLFPLAMYSYDWNKFNVALAISLFAAGDIVAKLLFVVSSQFIQFNNRRLYMIGLVIAFITRIGIQFSANVTAVMILFSIMGMSRCFFQVLTPLLVSDMVETKRFPSAHGLIMLTYGVVNILFAPLVGALRDLTQSYSVTFLALTGCVGVVTIVWSIDLYFYNRKQNNKIRSDDRSENK